MNWFFKKLTNDGYDPMDACALINGCFTFFNILSILWLITDWYRSYFDHLADAWDNYRDDPKVYFLYYEKLKQVGILSKNNLWSCFLCSVRYDTYVVVLARLPGGTKNIEFSTLRTRKWAQLPLQFWLTFSVIPRYTKSYPKVQKWTKALPLIT